MPAFVTLYLLVKLTRSLGIRLRVQAKHFFLKIICCATLVRWATPTTPRRTTFLHELREKKKFKTIIKPSLSLLSESGNQNLNF